MYLYTLLVIMLVYHNNASLRLGYDFKGKAMPIIRNTNWKYHLQCPKTPAPAGSALQHSDFRSQTRTTKVKLDSVICYTVEPGMGSIINDL